MESTVVSAEDAAKSTKDTAKEKISSLDSVADAVDRLEASLLPFDWRSSDAAEEEEGAAANWNALGGRVPLLPVADALRPSSPSPVSRT